MAGVLAGMLLTMTTSITQAQVSSVFNMPTGEASLDFVTVGDPGNAADRATGFGSVGYTYEMGEDDVTTAQYCQFLNAVAKTDKYGLYSPYMANVGGTPSPTQQNCGSGITRSGSSGSYTYGVVAGCANLPVNFVSWGDAARFCNWLQNGQPTGAEAAGTTETGAYTLNGGITATRNAGATYFLPSENEWYKAAYYQGGGTNGGYWFYPTQSNNQPSNVLSATGTNNANYYGNQTYTNPPNYLTAVGAFAASPGPYGTYDMGGDVWQWTDQQDWRGGSWATTSTYLQSTSHGGLAATSERNGTGFRVATAQSTVIVPPPPQPVADRVFAQAFGTSGSGPGQFNTPYDVAVDSSGNVWVADYDNARVQEFTGKGQFIQTFGTAGDGNANLRSPRGVVVDSSGNVWVADSGHGLVKEFTNQGGFIRSFGKGNPDDADAVALDSAGNVYVANLAGGKIEKYSSTGTLLQTIVSPQLYEPSGVAVDSSGNIWVASLANHQIVEFASNGTFERLICELTPYGISVDTSGNVWVADPNIAPYNINEFSSTGAYIQSVGADADLQGCTGVTVDSSGNVWVANMGESQIVELSPVPEPSTLVLLGVGAVSLLAYAWRRRRTA